MAEKSVWRAVVAGALLAIMFVPFPAATAAWNGPDRHQFRHKDEDAPALRLYRLEAESERLGMLK